MCLRVDANGNGDSKGTHVSVFLNMMRGEFDDHLSWPFRGEVRVQLLNQSRDGGHVEKALLQSSDFSYPGFTMNKRVVGREISARGRGYPQFIAHSKLDYNAATNCQYLMNNCLKFGIPKIKLV